MKLVIAATLAATVQANAVIRNTQLWEEMRAGKYLETPEPYTYLEQADLPTTFTWADVNGTNYLTTLRNQVGSKFMDM